MMMATVIHPEIYRVVALKQALRIHVLTQGRMKLTRTATPTRMLEMASEYTGKQYRRGQQDIALQDLENLLESFRQEGT
jgi:hypothetical protein